MSLITSCASSASKNSEGDFCLNSHLIMQKNFEFNKLSKQAREAILKHNEFYCAVCSDFNDICEDVD